MPFFDLISLVYGFVALRTLMQLLKSWKAFWDDEVTPEELNLADAVAFFLLIPITVFFHEAGHALATWQVGGEVIEFQWRVFWGYIVAGGTFTPVEDWWIAFSGNLVSILLALLPIPLIRYARRIQAELLYAFVRHMVYYALIWYPAISFGGFGGDWVRIYDFSVAPFAHITLLLHLALLYGLWRLDHSAPVRRWRIARHPRALARLNTLEEAARSAPSAEAEIELARFYHHLGEEQASKQHEKRAEELAPRHPGLKVLQAALAYERKQYEKAAAAARVVLEEGASAEDRAWATSLLAFIFMHQGRSQEALSQFDAALALSPDDHTLYYWRAELKRSLGQREAARLDYEQARHKAPDDASRAWVDEALARAGG